MNPRSSSDRRAELKPGDQAPDFELKASDGKTYILSDLRGKEVVIAWFPKADTPGCTKECQSITASGAKLRKFNVAYFTASVDDVEANKKFAEKFKMDFPILSDPDGTAAKAYGIYNGERKAAARTTFIIGKDGKILFIDNKVNTTEHGADLAKKLAELDIPKS